jgi:4-hydroxybutyryl-CoA dehydratase/vinylacetyl-CoA-Delta-isomerase
VLKVGLKTVKEYIESLRDGRVVYLDGERVEDVTTHPKLKVCVNTAAMDYAIAEMPEYRDLAVVTDEKTGEPISRYYYPPKNAEDLLKRHELMLTGSRLNFGVIPFTKDIAADSIYAIIATARAMARDKGKKEYVERAEKYLRYLQKNDLSAAGAMTDVKGDRSLRPSDPNQAHPDYYVRVVEENKDGIIVRGAKAHITGAAYFNEIIELPCRNMTEADADYAVSFAIPVDTEGVTQVVHPFRYRREPGDFPSDCPVRAHTDSFIIFDDVFVPWERVFMCREWEYARLLVYNFAYFHRHTAVTYHIPIVELFVGAAQALAEYIGVNRTSNIREKMTDLIIYLNTMKSLARASCMDHVMYEGIAVPNPVISNIAKYYYANNYHNYCTKIVEDIAGGILTTSPTYRDWQNPEIKPFMEKYLSGRKGTTAEERLRMLDMLRYYPFLNLEGDVLNIHAEGSLMAQRLTIYAESLPEIEEYKKSAKILAGIEKLPSEVEKLLEKIKE